MNEAIQKTKSFFSIEGYPLTFSELSWYLFSPGASWEEIFEEKTIAGMITRHPQEVENRMQRFFFSERKMKKAQRVVSWLVRLVPGISMVGVCNHVAFFHASKESDIDICIVCEKGKLYQTRFLTVLFLFLWRQRPSKRSRRDKICASFFMTPEGLNLEPLQKGRDVYLWYWIASFWPLYEKDQMYERFWQANTWVRNYLPNIHPVQPDVTVKTKPWGWWKKGMEVLFTEAWCKKIQKRRLPQYLREKCNQGTDVILNEVYLKFHANDRRTWYEQEWRKRYEAGV